MNFDILQFPNIGVLRARLSEEQLMPIKNEIEKIKNNFDSAKKYNHTLVGNIRKEFELLESKSYLQGLLNPYIYDYHNSTKILDRTDNLTEPCDLILYKAWVNFQEKYEFNPIHMHSGVLSFVIWISIPYSIEDEIKNSPGANSANPIPGNFSFHYVNCLGEVSNQDIKADKSMENTLLLFPAKLNHSVSPFYTSDSYRVSVSGNFKFKVV